MAEIGVAGVERDALRRQVSEKYEAVAENPELGFHFHTGRGLTRMLGYREDVVDTLPPGSVESFAGTGNPFTFGDLAPGETAVDVGCGAGFDTLIAARQVGPGGLVIAVDMTPAMLHKASTAADAIGVSNVEFHRGFAESLPVPDQGADVIISNGVVNLCPDKPAVFADFFRVLKPGGRLQIGDIVVHKPVPQDAKDDIDLWSG
jgi:SAM-dependent methyltransferase